MTVMDSLVPAQDLPEMRADVVFCGRCSALVGVNDILDNVALGRPDNECPRCFAPALVLFEPDGLDIA